MSESKTTKPIPSMTIAFFLYAFLPFISLVGLKILESDYGIAISDYLTWIPKQSTKKKTSSGGIPKNKKKSDPLRAKTKTDKEKRKEKTKENEESHYTEEIAKAIANRKKMEKQKVQMDDDYYDDEEDEIESILNKKKNGYRTRNDDLQKAKEIDTVIDNLRKEHKKDPNDFEKALALAEALRMRDYNIHDGGSAQIEGINTYKHVIKLISSTNKNVLPHVSAQRKKILCGLHVCLGKMYFVANMFDRALESFETCLGINEDEIDALAQKGAVLYILGRFKDSADAYLHLIDADKDRLNGELYTGLSKVLVANETGVEGGWDVLVDILNEEIPRVTKIIEDSSSQHNQYEQVMYDNLKRMHLAMFLYHDVKTKNTERAWYHLQTGWYYKMAILPPWMSGNENNRVSITKAVFHKDFWPSKIGSRSKTPIFIIGFVRCGSTLLERLLDSHPLIAGTGEDSVFNGRLGYIRSKIVEVSASRSESLEDTLNDLADEVVDGMKSRWKLLLDNAYSYVEEDDKKKSVKKGFVPKRFADKMLSNYMNVGFINMIFPNALILHVVREPMDTLFSAFKHDFPPSVLDYTCQFPALAELYLSYRDMMDHWENVLPGRITHIRYEDLVQDMPRIAHAIIAATGLKWDPDVLNFHKKKHAVNTLSTHQVRQGVYSHHIHSWKRYEKELKPLVKLIGTRTTHTVKTSLPGYTPPQQILM